MTHHPEESRQCDLRGCTFTGTLAEHDAAAHPWKEKVDFGLSYYDAEFHCTLCRFKTVNDYKLEEHCLVEHNIHTKGSSGKIQWHTTKQVYICVYCRLKCNSFSWAKLHAEKMHSNLISGFRICCSVVIDWPKYSCNECKFESVFLSMCIQHVTQAHKDLLLTCEKCQVAFPNEEQLERHRNAFNHLVDEKSGIAILLKEGKSLVEYRRIAKPTAPEDEPLELLDKPSSSEDDVIILND